MQTIVVTSLSGGQGKTTTSMLLGRLLSNRGFPTLLIDADPQHNLTDWCGFEVTSNSPTLLEGIKGSVNIEDCIYPLAENQNLFIIPSDDQLDSVQDYLSGSGVGAMLLKKRLQPISNAFSFIIIDSPPQRSQLCLTVIGCGDLVVIPAEASVKGYGSLVRTLDLINSLVDVGATQAHIVGVVPFRDRWFGVTQSNESKLAVASMRDEVGEDLMVPSIRESERYKQAINQQKTLTELGYPDLEYPIESLFERIEASRSLAA